MTGMAPRPPKACVAFPYSRGSLSLPELPLFRVEPCPLAGAADEDMRTALPGVSLPLFAGEAPPAGVLMPRLSPPFPHLWGSSIEND